MKTKLCSLLFTMIAAASAYAGDIFEIRPCDQFGNTRTPYATLANPITNNLDTVYFTIRLQVRDAAAVMNVNANGLKRYFKLEHINPLQDAIYDDYVEQNRLGVGIYVSGKPAEGSDVIGSGKIDFASLVSIVPNSNSKTNFFDCVFEYTPKSGDFALPVRLAVVDRDGITGAETVRPADDSQNTASYYFRNTDKWQINYYYYDGGELKSGGKVDWTQCALNSFPKGASPSAGINVTSYGRDGDFTLANVGLYLKTVDFDREVWEGADFWREVPMGDEIRCPVKSFADTGVDEVTTLYVWSTDESAVKISGGETVEVVTNKVGDVEYKESYQVGTVTFGTHCATANFTVLGVMSNKIANVVLSPWKGFRYRGATYENAGDYLTIPVKCGDMPVPSVEVSFDAQYPKAPSSKVLKNVVASTNFNDRAADAIPLYVTLTKAPEHEVTVGIGVRYEADTSVDPIAEHFVSVSKNGEEFIETDTSYTNLVFAAGEKQKTVYVYPLGGDSNTKNSGITFRPTVVSSTEDVPYEVGDPALLQIDSKHDPVIYLPEADWDYGSVPSNPREGFDMDIFINDCYRDMKGTNFIVTIKCGSVSTTSLMNFPIGDSMMLSITNYAPTKVEQRQKGTITIQDKEGAKKVTRDFYFTAVEEPQKTAKVAFFDTVTGKRYDDDTLEMPTEGSSLIPVVYCSDPYVTGSTCYFFLRPVGDTASYVSGTCLDSQGIAFVGAPGKTNTALNASSAITLLDGCSRTENGALEFELVARTEPTIDGGDPVVFYDSMYVPPLNIANVNTDVQQVKVNGALDPVDNDVNAVWKHSVAARVDVPFQAKLNDPSKLGDVAAGLMTVWCFTDGRTSNQYKYEFARIDNGTDVVTVNHQFTYSGGSTQDVAVVALDKDMLKAITGAEDFTPTTEAEIGELWTALSDNTKPATYSKPYRFKVIVGKKPSVMVSFPAAEDSDTITINENDSEIKMRIELNEPAHGNTTVLVTVQPRDASDPGVLELEQYEFIIADGDLEPDKNDNDYYDEGVLIKREPLDGTSGSYDRGFDIKVEVTDCDEGPGYFDFSKGRIYVRNTPPVIYPKQPENLTTNKSETVGVPFTLEWSAQDVACDCNATDEDAKLTARWYIDGMEVASAASTVNVNNQKQTTSLTLTSGGFHEVMLVVTDKEGENYNGSASRLWYYFVMPTKALEVTPFGPAGSTQSRYGTASGRGQGRVYANSGKYSSTGFLQTWTYGAQTDEARVYAWGYPSNSDADGEPLPYADDGTLAPDPSRDVPLTTYGNSWPTGTDPDPAACFTVSGEYDNYFYRWVRIGYPTTGGVATNEYEAVAATADPLTEVTTKVGLDPYQETRMNYATRMIEAIFSREKYSSDNCGDINADGIPDLYVSAYRFGVFDESMNMIGSDIDPIDDYNDDGDYLPMSLSATFEAFIPDITNNWVSQFFAVDEIRGFGKHFNDANLIPENDRVTGIGIKSDIRFTDPAEDKRSTLEPVEWAAYKAYCEKMGWDESDESHWGIGADGTYDNGWSPERPTDPTKDDTDKDGIGDGFEYWVWYKAHVGELRDGELFRLTGRRYIPARPCEPEVIDADTIAELYDPLVGNGSFATLDTDNDGLPDFIEYVLGTNPLDFDTDGDGLPDGYELYVTQTDPLLYATDKVHPDCDLNPDGDAMAIRFAEEASVVAYVDDDGVTNYFACTKADGFTVEDGKITGAEGKVYTAWRYWGVGGSAEEPLPIFCVGREIEEGFCVGKETAGEQFESELIYLHFHVYQEFGFDPRTGWNIPPFYIGHLVDTVPFTHMDEFLTLAFYINAGGQLPPTVAMKWQDYFKQYVSNPRNIGNVPGTIPDDILFQLWTLGAPNPLDPDTDKDGMPDGWELYVQAGKRDDALVKELGSDLEKTDFFYGPLSYYSPLADFAEIAGTVAADPEDGHGDHLDFPHEYSGYESVALYTNKCDTIVLLQPEWKNKIWPTDPWNGDTDGDGLLDGAEGNYFVYGTNTHHSSSMDDCVSGGGLCPYSWDTDRDGLPDSWEAEFPGVYVIAEEKVYVSQPDVSEEEESEEDEEGSDGPVASDEEDEEGLVLVKDITTTGWQGGMDGTTADDREDYDKDGLQNWQEYMVGAMRCWRYDDTISRWDCHKTAQVDFSAFTDDDWYDFIVNPASTNFCHTFGNERFDPGVYFCCATNIFENAKVRGKMYMLKDGYYHDLKKDAKKNHYNRWSEGKGGSYTIKDAYPAKYITCDPRSQDTDGDGMDDYYELFHGLNPLLGSSGLTGKPGKAPRDIVYESWTASLAHGYAWKATCNYWFGDGASVGRTREDYPLHVKDGTGYDFFQFPWLTGLAEADFDGDNLRNQQEALLSNVQAANTYLHTDPSPLWATDMSFEDSLTHRYYMLDEPEYAETKFKIPAPKTFTHEGVEYKMKDFLWLKYDAHTGTISPDPDVMNRWETLGPMFSFEQNEGYDSDHDYLSDFEEAQGKTKNCSDPQVTDDPLRRQAMWFGGKDDPGFLQSPMPEDEIDKDGHTGDLRRDFLYFTVECWAKADEESLENGLHTLVERATVSGTSGPADEQFLRKNFLIGIRNGRWYAKFDSTGTDLNQPVEITDGPFATTNWTHVAAAYDGSSLKLYVDGLCRSTLATMVMPEHGLSAITITDYGEMYNKQIQWKNSALYPRWMNSILVGASACTTRGVAFDLKWQLRDQLVASEYPYVYEGSETTIADYDSFFKGYIDEVRIWDGARKSDEIHDDFNARTRYTPELALESRQKALKAALEGGNLAPVAGATEMPADLRYHWSFDHVAGAVQAEDMMNAPAGFQTLGNVTDAKAYWARPEGWTCPWLDSVDESIQSKVFTDHAWVPWIVNTVAHLPRLDGTTLDSVYWSENYAGIVSAPAAGYSTFAFKRNAEVYSCWKQCTWSKQHHGRYSQGATDELINYVEKYDEYTFNLRGKTTIGCDLLPFGSAYPKRISQDEGGMWDGQGPADAWAQTGDDTTHDGLPDWWEEYARENYTELDPSESFTWSTTVKYCGVEMPAWNAYMRDLAKGMLPDLEYHEEFADIRDNDHDGMPDWWENLYGIDTGSYADAVADDDNDGLSNYVEYMLSEVFDLKRDGVPLSFDPKNPYSVDTEVSDYFYRLGELYVGEIFTDHDHMDDQWEQKFLDKVSPYLYDAGDDADEDGWSNYAEFQAGTDPTLLGSIGIDEVQIDEFPVPTIELSVNYEGNQNVIDAPLIVKAWSDTRLESVPDAVWTVGKVIETKEVANGNTENVSGMKYLGMNPGKELMFHLSPGSLVKNTVKFEYKDVNWFLWDTATGQTYYTDGATAIWNEVLNDREIPEQPGKGEIIDKAGGNKVVGTIDYTTGEVVLDLTAVSQYQFIVGDISGGVDLEGTFLSVYNLDKSYIRVKWSAKPIVGGKSATYYLSDADEPSAECNSIGHVKEGANTFIAFYDLDGDGKYTAGEPYGASYAVDVGWNYARTHIELTDTHVVSARFSAADGANDREVLFGKESTNYDESRFNSAGGSGGQYERVRVVRTFFDNEKPISKEYQRVVLDKKVELTGDQLYITEADFLKDGQLDIDWDYLAEDLEAARLTGNQLTNIAYGVVLGNGPTDPGNATYSRVMFMREFDIKSVFNTLKPVTIGPEIFNAPSPTFSWYIPSGLNTYTAFRLEVSGSDGFSWDSGFQAMPPRVRDASVPCGWRYDWTAPIFADDKLPNGKVFKNDVNYSWRIRIANAKYKNTEVWSESKRFRMNVLTNSTDYGSIDVAVRYYGPEAVTGSGTIRVQAFETPDFTGTPVGQGYVYDLSEINVTNKIVAGNARIIGLKTGSYYLRAYVDSNKNGKRDEWETWGYTCVRDGDLGTIYSPRSVKVGPALGVHNIVSIFLDDCDTDRDNLPDAWEYASFGSLTAHNVNDLDEVLANQVAVKQSLAGTIEASGKIAGGLSVLTMRSLSSPYIAAMACGVKVPAGASAEGAAAALYAAVEDTDLVENSAKITSLELDTASRQVKIGVVGELASSASVAPAASIYSFDISNGNTVTCKVWRKTALTSSDWTLVTEVKGVAISLAESVVTVDLGDDVDVASGYFKITLEKEVR